MLIIKNGHLTDPKAGLDGLFDLYINGGTVAAVVPAGEDPGPLENAESVSAGEQGCAAAEPGRDDDRVIDASGLHVFPGFIDTHSHFRDPGFTEKEDILTGAVAAAAGGYTSVILMANTKPPVDTPETLSYVLNRGKETPLHVYSAANVTRGMKGQELTDLRALKETGAKAFTDDGIPVMNGELLRSALIEAAALNIPVSLHEEDPAHIRQAGINAGEAAAAMGLEGADRMAEISMAERDLKLAAETGCDLVIQHVSAKETVELLRKARAAGARVHGEATPHHFSLTDRILLSKGTAAKCNPPIRTEEDRLAIIEGLRDGTLEIIATDHAPHTSEEKARPFTKAPSGMIGLETAFPLVLKNLVQPGYLSLSEAVACLTCTPAELYGLNAGTLKPGMPADISVWDLSSEHTFDHFRSKASNSPFLGETLPGELKKLIVNGKEIEI